MSYLEKLEKRDKLIRKSNNVMSEYIEIADELYNKETSKYAGLIDIKIEESGIYYEYYNDNWDYTAGRSGFFVKREKIEEILTTKKYNL